MQIDTSTPFGERVARRLEQEIVVWLTTVRPNGTPEPSPVWFLWDGQTALIYSRPNNQKLRNIAANPNVALSFDGSSFQFQGAIPLGASPLALTSNSQTSRAYVTDSNLCALSVLDSQQNTVVATIGVGQRPTAVAVNTTVAVAPTALASMFAGRLSVGAVRSMITVAGSDSRVWPPKSSAPIS